MSRFAAAQAKAASTAAPKVAAKAAAKSAATAAPTAASKARAKPAVALNTLAEKKAYVSKMDLKIEDAEQEMNDEPNRAARKELETKLKNLQKDEMYLKTKEEVKELDLQAIKDAERAKIAASPQHKAKASPKVGPKVPAEAKEFELESIEDEKGVVVDEATIAEIDKAFAGTGKDAATAKAKAVAKMAEIAAATPFVLHRLDKLIALFADSKLGAPSIKAACAIVAGTSPQGHGIASVAMPALLAGMDAKTWKTKAGCIEVLLPCLQQMVAGTPAQLALCLAQVVPKLAEAALEVRAEIRTATSSVLRHIGTLVASPEIKKLAQDLVTALAEPTNQKHTQAVLAKMGNQTFLSLIDAASLSLLMPVVVRGLKERDSASKKWSAQIFGSTAMLVADMEDMRPYLKQIMPLMQAALTDPVPEVQREAAKAFGILEHVLPDFSRNENQPWLFQKLRNGEVSEQMGSSLALAEVFTKMDKTQAEALIPEIQAGAMDLSSCQQNRGFMELVDAMPNAMKMDFVPYIDKLFPAMLFAITGDQDESLDIGKRAALSLVGRFGDLCAQWLLPAFETVYAETLHSESDAYVRQQIVREKCVFLLGKCADKILEHKKFGQDLLTTEDCTGANRAAREYLLSLLFVTKFDVDAGVKRLANGTWKTVGGAPKMQKAIMPAIEKLLLKWRSGVKGIGAQKHANEVIAALVASKEIEAPTDDEPPVATRFIVPPPVGRVEGSQAARICNGESPDDEDTEFARQISERASSARELLEAHPGLRALAADIRSHCAMVAESIVVEGRKRKQGGAKIVPLVAEGLNAVLGDVAAALEKEVLAAAEALTRAALGSAFDALGAADADEANMLLKVENLLLMYGAGHLLLKDTTLEMRMNHCYGVVGQNGAGKTTLMKEIANHRIVGMPKELKCVHVDDSKLSDMTKSCLTALEYVIKMAKDIGVTDAGRDTLLAVGFGERMLDEPVSELSTGWRMRLTLAVSMLKHADLVLLDEPTNHLDEESVQWLTEYILSINKSSVMVISHEPKLLNKICTHVVAYVDRKLEYHKGNFDTFAAQKGLSKEQIDAMLSGNLSFDEKSASDDEDGDKPKIASAVAGPPKLSFPIPGAMEGVKSGSRAVLEAKNLSFRYSSDKDYLIQGSNLKLTLGSRVAICGRNGCGKSTLMTLLCSEANASEGKDGQFGEVWRHCNLRMAYMKQDHLKALGPFFDTSPFVYITTRFKDGYDGDLQRRLMEPEDEDEALRRQALAKEYGKYGNPVEELVSRKKIGNVLSYEVKWQGLDDPKQNTIVSITTLKAMGLEKVVIACDERIAAKAAGLDQRPLTRREVIRHVEAFGIDEEMCCNRQIRGFSSGQKVRLSLAAMFWTKPHLIAVDEPTNYLDVETVEALAKALTNFRGGIVMIEPKTDFVERICNEKWHMENGAVTVEKLKNDVKRMA